MSFFSRVPEFCLVGCQCFDCIYDCCISRWWARYSACSDCVTRSMCFVHVFCSYVLFMCFVHVFCSCVLFMCFVHVFCSCVLFMCFVLWDGRVLNIYLTVVYIGGGRNGAHVPTARTRGCVLHPLLRALAETDRFFHTILKSQLSSHSTW